MIKKAKVERGLKLHQGDVRGLKKRGLETKGLVLGRLGDSRKLGANSGGGKGNLIVDDGGIGLRFGLEIVGEQRRWLAPESDSAVHPFKVIPQGDDTVVMSSGIVMHMSGSSTNTGASPEEGMVYDGLEVATTSSITVTGDGYIVWECDLNEQTIASYTVGTDTVATLRKGLDVASESTSFFTTANVPVGGAGNDIGTGVQRVYVKIAQVNLDGGVAKVVTQFVQSNFFIHQDCYAVYS